MRRGMPLAATSVSRTTPLRYGLDRLTQRSRYIRAELKARPIFLMADSSGITCLRVRALAYPAATWLCVGGNKG
jgi:hypothetical protein